jgi:hypothetical protein
MVVPIQVESKKVDCGEKINTQFDELWIFNYAFIIGKFNNSGRWFDYFKIWNPDFSHTIYVLGYSGILHTFIPVKAYEVFGSWRIGFFGIHHCMIFAFGPGSVTAFGDGPY